jgi:hypothetical protein
MNASQALSLQSLLLKLAAPLGGEWTPARASVGDISIQANSRINGHAVNASLTIFEGRSLHISGEIRIESVDKVGGVDFRGWACTPLADLEFDTIAEAFDQIRAEVAEAQRAAAAEISTIRAAEAAAALN